MYGWIVDGISSLFEPPVTGQKPAEWPGKGGKEESSESRRRENHARPAKRNYQSVHVADNVCQTEQVAVKRRRRDVVISFVKKTVEGVACLLRLRNPLTPNGETHGHEKPQIQPITLMGIDELHSSCMCCSDWRMDKTSGGPNERDRGGKNPFQSTLPPFMRKYSGGGLTTGIPERGKDRDRQSSLQPLPSRPALGVGTSAGATVPDVACPGVGQNRWYKSSLTVEEAIKQNNKEHYRRLLEMVTEKCNKSQPLPFSQTRPQEVSITQGDSKATVLGKACDSVIRKIGPITATPSLFLWRDAPTTRRGDLCFNYTLNGAFGDRRHVRCVTKQQAEMDLSTEVATRLNLVDRGNPALTRLDTYSKHTTHTLHSEEDFPRLTKDMAAEVSRALAQSNPDLVLSAAFKLRITQRDLTTLQEGSWLNDEVINFYLSLVMEHCTGQAGGLKVYSFSTFFFPKLRGGVGGQAGGHAAVKRWTKAVDLFIYDLVLVPLHLGVHWAMAVIDFKSRTVKSYDSMGQRHDDVCTLLLHYLREEHNTKKGQDFDISKWIVCSLRPSEIPQQKNGSDCGVFTCKYAHFISKGRPLTFKQCHMPLFRKLMIWEILNQKLL